MKNLLTIAFFFFCVLCMAQSKEQLIDSIIKENVFHSEYIGGAGTKSRVYTWYEQLMELVTDDELIALAKHKNAALRMYAIQGLIARSIADVPLLFTIEMESGEMVETLNGCSMEWEQTCSVVYGLQTMPIAQKAYRISINEEEFEKMLNEDSGIRKTDIIVLTYKKPVSWVMYMKVFYKKKFDKALLPNIEYLAFEQNNSYAFNYFEEYYPKEYRNKLDNYLIKTFPKAKFSEGENFMIAGDWVYLRYFIEKLLESDLPGYKAIAINKLRENQWLAEIDQWYNITLEKYNIKM